MHTTFCYECVCITKEHMLRRDANWQKKTRRSTELVIQVRILFYYAHCLYINTTFCSKSGQFNRPTKQKQLNFVNKRMNKTPNYSRQCYFLRQLVHIEGIIILQEVCKYFNNKTFNSKIVSTVLRCQYRYTLNFFIYLHN